MIVCEWLASLLGLPAQTEGVLLSGGSMANITGLMAVRAVRSHPDQTVVYLSDQTHSSIGRGLRAAGFAADDLRVLATDDGFRLPLPAVRQAIAEDRGRGRRPLVVVATAGTTNTGVGGSAA